MGFDQRIFKAVREQLHNVMILHQLTCSCTVLDLSLSGEKERLGVHSTLEL